MARSWFPSELKSFWTIATGPRSVAVAGIGVKVNCFCAVKGVALESVAVKVNVKLGGVVVEEVGVPVISPVAAFKLKPAGREPVETLQVNGAVPPEAERIWS